MNDMMEWLNWSPDNVVRYIHRRLFNCKIMAHESVHTLYQVSQIKRLQASQEYSGCGYTYKSWCIRFKPLAIILTWYVLHHQTFHACVSSYLTCSTNYRYHVELNLFSDAHHTPQQQHVVVILTWYPAVTCLSWRVPLLPTNPSNYLHGKPHASCQRVIYSFGIDNMC